MEIIIVVYRTEKLLLFMIHFYQMYFNIYSMFNKEK